MQCDGWSGEPPAQSPATGCGAAAAAAIESRPASRSADAVAVLYAFCAVSSSVMRVKNWSSIILVTPPSIRWPTLAISPPTCTSAS
jgi:hypothetical protein